MTQRPARQSARVKALLINPNAVMEDISFANRNAKRRAKNRVAKASRRKNRV